MASKTMEGWFLRGGERPQGKLPDPPDEIPVDDDKDFDDDDEDVIYCPHCGGENLASEECCTHCGQPLYDEDDEDDEEAHDFIVTLTRTKTISQTATMRVSATTAHEAMDRAEDEASDIDDDWDDVPDSEEFGDAEADTAEEED